MSRPFFTIAIPTKDRPDLLKNAIRSVLRQTFQDFEIIVSDNSDEARSLQTANLIKEFGDPRIRYSRASGHLSMPDNWENAITDTRGEFVGILTDRSVLLRSALEIIHSEVEQTGTRLVSWTSEMFGRDHVGKPHRTRPHTLRRHRLDRDTILNFFLHGPAKLAPKIIPRLMNAVCHRSVLDAIRASAVGRCCPPVCPDYTSGLLMLAHCDWALVLDRPLFISCGTGNGWAFRRRGELADNFLRDLNMTWKELVDRVPSTACFTHGLILNDFMRMREKLPDQLGDFELDRAQYYAGCLMNYVKVAGHVPDLTQDLDILIDALNFEDDEIQAKVRAERTYLRAIFTPPIVTEFVDKEAVNYAGDSVFDLLDQIESNPPNTVEETFLDGLSNIQEKKDCSETFLSQTFEINSRLLHQNRANADSASA